MIVYNFEKSHCHSRMVWTIEFIVLFVQHFCKFILWPLSHLLSAWKMCLFCSSSTNQEYGKRQNIQNILRNTCNRDNFIFSNTHDTIYMQECFQFRYLLSKKFHVISLLNNGSYTTVKSTLF